MAVLLLESSVRGGCFVPFALRFLVKVIQFLGISSNIYDKFSRKNIISALFFSFIFW